MPPIEWTEKELGIDRLKPFEQNSQARDITDLQYTHLLRSLIEDGYHSRIKVTHDLRVIGGHQRLRAMKELGWDRVKVLIPDRHLTDDQFLRIMLRDNHNNGTHNMDWLANTFELEWLRQEIGLREVLDIAPEQNEEPKPPGYVRCPECQCEFPTKGNKV